MSARSRRPSAAVRLLVAQLGILAAGLVVAAVVSGTVGPSVFHGRLMSSGLDPAVAAPAERAFHAANWIDIAIVALITVVLAGTAAAALSRRVNSTVTVFAAAADGLARGDYRARIDLPTLTPETDRIAEAFNEMAGRLRGVEATRRRLLDDLAHELRTPVATLEGYLEGLEDGVVPASADTLALLRAQTARMARLIGDLSAVSAAEEGRLVRELVPSEPGRIMLDAAAAARGMAARDHPMRDVTVEVEIADGLPLVAVDRERIDQAITNLVANALRHGRAGGTVRLGARAVGRDAVELSVADDGDGIAAEHLPHVFERFYRVDRARDRARGGSGIGLTITQAIVRAHHGTVTADSAGPGKGATFTISLPAAHPPR